MRPPRAGMRHARSRRRGGPRRRRARRPGGVARPRPGGRRLGRRRRRLRKVKRGSPVGGLHVGQRLRVGCRRHLSNSCVHRDGGHERPRRVQHGHRRRDAGHPAIVAGRCHVGNRRHRLRRNGAGRRRWGNPRGAARGLGSRQWRRHAGGSRRRPQGLQGGRRAERQRPERTTRGAASRWTAPLERHDRRPGQTGRGGAGGACARNTRGRPIVRRWNLPTRRIKSGTAWAQLHRKAARSGGTCRRWL